MSRKPAVASPGDLFQTSAGPQGVFRVLLDAMARPGTVRQLTDLDKNTPFPAGMGLAAVAQTLLDHEVTFAVARGNDDRAAQTSQELALYVRSVTGCREVPAPEADYVLAPGKLPAGLAALLKRGHLAYPDEGATLVSLVPPLDGTSGIIVGLSGPGVPPGTVATVPGWSAEDLANLAEVNAAAPLGIDVVLVDASGRVMCLPRSTRISDARLTRTPADEAGGIQEVANGLHRG